MQASEQRMTDERRRAARYFTDDYLAYLLARASTLVSRQFHARVSRAGLRIPEWRVLATLYDRESLTIGGLAEITLLKQPTLTRVTARLEEQGWVQRRDEPEDRRITRFSITAAGQEKVRPLLERAKAHEAQVLNGYPPEEVETLKAGLREMIARLSEQQ